MARVKTAVILAAGFGSRLQGIWNDQPKGLIPVEGISLIERSLNNLLEYGIERVLIGTGHRAEAYDDLRKKHPYIETVYSGDYATTSSFSTLMKLRNILNEDILLLESDLLYDKRAIEFLQSSPTPDLILSSEITSLGDEVFLEVNEREELMDLSKNKANLGSIHSVLVGINKLSTNYLRSLFEKGEEFLAKDPKIDYEKAFVALYPVRPIKVASLPELAWTEVDTPEHYHYALKTVLPRIQAWK